MQKRIFLGNRALVKSSITGKNPIALGYQAGNTNACSDYNLEKKREKALIKLNSLIDATGINISYNKNKYANKLNLHTSQEDLIEFIETKFNNTNEVVQFFTKLGVK